MIPALVDVTVHADVTVISNYSYDLCVDSCNDISEEFVIVYRAFQDFEGPTSLNLCHCKQLRFPDCHLFHSTHDSFNNSKTHSSKTFKGLSANPEIVIASSGKGLN